ncbi:uncharacterized protein KIAA2012 homolog isoform X1 [Latimeria chalumnae]|uniref:uncharacterized protein KIAA2012 homolog isoform X1 n=1 Tax=Latimeria chalumnae TaxID=7897 RepID=UPI00313E2B49
MNSFHVLLIFFIFFILQECGKDSSVGSLIMGPDGEIVCLSLLGSVKDPTEVQPNDIVSGEGYASLGSSASDEEAWLNFQHDREDNGPEDFRTGSASFSWFLEQSSQNTEQIPRKGNKRGSKNKTSVDKESQYNIETLRESRKHRKPYTGNHEESESEKDYENSTETGEYYNRTKKGLGSVARRRKMGAGQHHEHLSGFAEDEILSSGEEAGQDPLFQQYSDSSLKRRMRQRSPSVLGPAAGSHSRQGLRGVTESGNNEEVRDENYENGSGPRRRRRRRRKFTASWKDELLANYARNEPLTEEEEESLSNELSKQAENLSAESVSRGKGRKKNSTKERTSGSVKTTKDSERDKRHGRAEFVVGKPREKRDDEKPKKKRLQQASGAAVEGGEEVLSGEEEVWSSGDEGRFEVGAMSNRSASPSQAEGRQFTAKERSNSRLSVVFVVTPVSEELPKSTLIENLSKNGQLTKSARQVVREEQAKQRRMEVERKRQEREEQKRQEQQEKQEREDQMRKELEREQRKIFEAIRLRKQQQEDERLRQEEEEANRARQEQMERERAHRQQQEYHRKLLQLQQQRQQEELQRAAENERRRKEEEERLAEECKLLAGMSEEERVEYLRKKQEEEERRRQEMEERRRRAEEQAKLVFANIKWQAELSARELAMLERHLRFHHGLLVELNGLERMQDVSRPWVFSYFQLLRMLELAPPLADLIEEDTLLS